MILKESSFKERAILKVERMEKNYDENYRDRNRICVPKTARNESNSLRERLKRIEQNL